MVKRVNIYVPAALAERLAQDHGVNVSAVCQEAISRALDADEEVRRIKGEVFRQLYEGWVGSAEHSRDRYSRSSVEASRSVFPVAPSPS